MCVEAGTRRSANHTQGHVAFGRALVKGNVRNGMALGSVCVFVCVSEREREREIYIYIYMYMVVSLSKGTKFVLHSLTILIAIKKSP